MKRYPRALKKVPPKPEYIIDFNPALFVMGVIVGVVGIVSVLLYVG